MRAQGVGSAQEAIVRISGDLPAFSLEKQGVEELLANASARYWRVATRTFLGIVRVVEEADRPRVVLLSRRLVLLRFGSPRQKVGKERGIVSWPIEDGLLVARGGRGQGFLEMSMERVQGGAGVRVRMEVRNFYPRIAGSRRAARLGAWLYAQTQARVHRFVTTRFLRSLERIEVSWCAMAASEFIGDVDFVGIPTRDLPAAAAFYGETLGLPRSVYNEERSYSEFETGNLTLSVYNAEKMGLPHNVNPNPIALHVDDVEASRKLLEERGVAFNGETLDTGVCHMAFFADPDGNQLMLHCRYAPRVTES